MPASPHRLLAARPLASQPLPAARALPAIAPARGSEARGFAEDVVLGLSSRAKQLPCKYFYDARGSALFDRITELDEYYPTRTEAAIMRAHAQAMAAAIGPHARIVELGSGSSVKTRLLLDALDRPAAYVPVDISAEHLAQAAGAIARDYPGLEVQPVAADFTEGFTLPAPARAANPSVGRTIVYFPGSTIGNFTEPQARALLRAVAELVGPHAHDDERPGGLLLGFDLVKDAATLEAAYDDALGVTAEFNLNLLARINRELHGDFDLDRFEHVAVWAPEPARIEIFIRSRVDQLVHAAGRAFRFKAGELLLTEYSHKYTPARIVALAAQAGLGQATLWTDPDALFGVGLFCPPRAI